MEEQRNLEMEEKKEETNQEFDELLAKKRKTHHKHAGYGGKNYKSRLEAQGEKSDEEEDEEEDSDAELDKGLDHYVDDGFVVGDDEVEEVEEEDSYHKRKKKRRNMPKPLDNEDIELIQENYKHRGMEEVLPSSLKKNMTSHREGKGKLKRLKKEIEEHKGKPPMANSMGELADEFLDDNIEEEHRRHPKYTEIHENESEDLNDENRSESEGGDMDNFIDRGDADQYNDYQEDVPERFSSCPISVNRIRIAQEIFGSQEEMDNMNSKLQSQPKEEYKKLKIEEIYGPEEIQSLHLTVQDQKIKITDIPERLQTAFEERDSPELEELKSEVNWIWTMRKESDSKEMIMSVLENYRKENFEAPFIYTYRKKMNFQRKDIWNIIKLDKEWGYLNKLKKSLQRRLDPVVTSYSHYQYVKDELFQINTVTELEDLDVFVDFFTTLLYMGKGTGVAQHIKLTRKQREIAKQVTGKIPEFAERVLLHPWELEENLRAMRVIHTPPDVKNKITLMAKEYISEGSKDFLDEKSVLNALIHYAATEISVMPYLRKVVRKFYMAYSVISTEPTLKGEAELDIFNPSYRVKNIIKRPVNTLLNDLWIDIKSHEAKGFIKVTIGLEKDKEEELYTQLSQYYLQDEEIKSEISAECNSIRSEILSKAFLEYLLPAAEKSCRKNLEEIAEEYITSRCMESFSKQLMAGPYRSKVEQRKNSETGEPEDFDKPTTVRVMSFIIDSELGRRPVAQMAIVDENGELLEHRLFNGIIIRNPLSLKDYDSQMHKQLAQK